jgi:hypothetical protein
MRVDSMSRVKASVIACRFANYLAHCCSDYLAHDRSWRALPDSERVSDDRNVPGLHVLSPNLLPLCQIVSTEVRHIIRKATVQSKTVKLGMSPDEVKQSLGNPDKIVDLGAKQVFIYKDVKVIFIDGKVSDVQ